MKINHTVCPKCGSKPKVQQTKYGERFSCCDLWSWGSGNLVCKGTHEARKLAHSSFDLLWKKHGMDRSEVYALLADGLGISKADCHMKLMDKETANRVPFIALRILNNDNS